MAGQYLGLTVSPLPDTVQISIVQNDRQVSFVGAEIVGVGDCNGEQVHGVQKPVAQGIRARTATIDRLRELPRNGPRVQRLIPCPGAHKPVGEPVMLNVVNPGNGLWLTDITADG